MESRSVSSSSESTIPSVLENSDYDEKQNESDNYEEDELESEGGDHDPPPVSLSCSSSDKYGSDEFEQDSDSSVTNFEVVEVASGERNSSAEDDYGCDSFEHEDEENSELESLIEVENEAPSQDHHVDPQENGQQHHLQNDKVEDDKQPVERDPLLLGNWCFTKIQDLKSTKLKLDSQPHFCKRDYDSIPTIAVENLINRLTASRQNDQRSTPRLRSREKLKVSVSLMQRAQTQLWVAESSRENTTTRCHPDVPIQKVHSTPSRSATTFCSVKREKLLGKLATMQLPETCKRWAAPESGGLSLATLDFVQNMAAKQREIHSSRALTDESGGNMLHRVAMTTRLQLEDSIALRHQAAELLGQVRLALNH